MAAEVDLGLRAEVAALREDAERYRLLKVLDRGAFIRLRGIDLEWHDADTAIDAARRK